MRVSLERVRDYSLAVTFASLPVLVAVVILGAVNDARPPWDTIFIGVGALILTAATTFTVTAIRLAMRRTRQEAAAGLHRNRSGLAIRLSGLLVLAANVAAVMLSGRVNLWNIALGVLLVLLLLLLREHARREGVRDSTR